MTQPVHIEGRKSVCIAGRAAALRIENLDTDQIIPKQFLRGIDKSGLKEGVLYDLRFDAEGRARPGFDLMPRHRQMFIEGLDSIGLLLTCEDRIVAFARDHWARQPWLRDVAAITRQRLRADCSTARFGLAPSAQQES